MVQRQKLELQVNRPVEVELLYDEPILGENQYGPYALYAVRSGESEFAFFPPKEVDESLRELKAGDKAVITKLAAQRGNKVVAKYEVAVNGNLSSKDDRSTKKDESSLMEKVPSDNLFDLMLQSLKDGMNLSEEISGLSLDHIIRISLTLFIQRTKNGNGHSNNNGYNH